MSHSFASVHNRLESVVFEAVRYRAARYPSVAADEGLLADVACVALNHLPPRYIRHPVDFSFFRDVVAHSQEALDIERAVSTAFDFVYSRSITNARPQVSNVHWEVEHQSAAAS